MEKKKNTKTEQSGPEVASNLKDFFIDGLKDIYYAENALVKALPKMFDQATDQKLKTAIKDHLAQTKEQVVRLEKAFD